MNNIAVLLSDQENYVEAEKLYEKVFQGFSKIFGSEHTETKRAKNNLALLQKEKESLQSEQSVEFVKEIISVNVPEKMKKLKGRIRERESNSNLNLKKRMKN